MPPSVARSQKRACPAAQRRQSSRPRTTQPMIGSTTTRRPSSSTTPTTSWPSTAGNEANGERMALACPVSSAMSVPQRRPGWGAPGPSHRRRRTGGSYRSSSARASSRRPGVAGDPRAGAAPAGWWPTHRSAALGRAPIRPPARQSRQSIGTRRTMLRTDPLQDLVQAVAGDGQAVVLEADDGAGRVGRLRAPARPPRSASSSVPQG